MTMKVGIEGRVITGPAGGPGTVDVPLRIAVVQEGVKPKTIVSKFARDSGDGHQRGRPRHLHPYRSGHRRSRCRSRSALIDAYVVYVGFDPLGAQPEKKKPRGASRRKKAGRRQKR